MEQIPTHLKIRYRIDGLLREVDAPPTRSTAAVTSRIKIMATLNIAERRLPQDGRIMTRVKGHEIDLRVSTIPTVHGESIVMRVLDRSVVNLSLENVGRDEAMMKKFRRQSRCETY